MTSPNKFGGLDCFGGRTGGGARFDAAGNFVLPRTMNQRFRITVGSESEYEDLVGDLYFDDSILLVLTQEAGFGAAQVEIFAPPGGGRWRFALRDFEEALAALKSRMWELRRTDPDRA